MRAAKGRVHEKKKVKLQEMLPVVTYETKRPRNRVLLLCLPAYKRQGHATQLDSIIHPINAAKKRKKK